jgi:hypothetical protein
MSVAQKGEGPLDRRLYSAGTHDGSPWQQARTFLMSGIPLKERNFYTPVTSKSTTSYERQGKHSFCTVLEREQRRLALRIFKDQVATDPALKQHFSEPPASRHESVCLDLRALQTYPDEVDTQYAVQATVTPDNDMCGDCAISFLVHHDINKLRAKRLEEQRVADTSMLAHTCKFLKSDNAVSAGDIMATAIALRTTLMTFCVNMPEAEWDRHPSLRSWIHDAADDAHRGMNSHNAALDVHAKFWRGDRIPWTEDGLWYGYAAILQCNIVIFPVVLNGFHNAWTSASFTNGPDEGLMPPAFFSPPVGIPARFTAFIANFHEFQKNERGVTVRRPYHYAPLTVRSRHGPNASTTARVEASQTADGQGQWDTTPRSAR